MARSPRAEHAHHLAGRVPALPDLDQGAHDRAHHLPTERARPDLVPQEPVVDDVPVRPQHPPPAWWSPRGPCGRRRRSRAPRRTGRRRAGGGRAPAARGPTTRSGRGRDRARAGSRPCSGRYGSRPSGGRRTPSRRRRAERTTSSGPSRFVSAYASRSGSTSAAVDRLTTWPHACTPASVRPAQAKSSTSPRSIVSSASTSSPATVRWPGCAAKPWKSVPSYATTSARCVRPEAGVPASKRVTPVRRARWARCRRDGDPASGSAGTHPDGSSSAARCRRRACA